MLTNLDLTQGTAAAAATAPAKDTTTVEAPAADIAIKRKIGMGDLSRENQIYTRAWAIYGRAKNRRAARAVSIL